jgi:hypothetical protein
MLTLPSVVALLVATSPAAPANPCHHDDKEGAACAPESAAAQPKEKDGVVLRGEKIDGKVTVGLSDLLKSPAAHDGKTVLVEGQVRKACSRKGCWMELATGTQDKGPGVRVTFKDYGFFVPLDAAGARAKVKGQVKLADLSEETAKHYESEGANVPRTEDGKPREVQLVASGVELRR